MSASPSTLVPAPSAPPSRGLELCHHRPRRLVAASRAGSRGLSPGAGLLVLILGLTALRLASAAAVPLTEDEAYYRLWSQHLHLGYFDHPPMIAWWIRLGTLAAGDNALGVRLAPPWPTWPAPPLVFDIGRLLADGRAGLKAALLYNCTLTIGAAAALAVPDFPPVCSGTLALWAMARAWASGKGPWWLLAGAAAAWRACPNIPRCSWRRARSCGWSSPRTGRKQLMRPWPWLAALLAMAAGRTVGRRSPSGCARSSPH